MRILYFTDTFLPQINGVTKTLDKLHHYLEGNEISHMFFTPAYPADATDNDHIKRFKSMGFPVYPECRVALPLYHNLFRMAQEFDPDIVHLVTPFGIGLAGLKYARENNLPVVASYHTNFDSHIKYYKLDFIEPILWKLLNWFHGHADINLGPSRDTLRIMEEKGMKNLQIWSRGIDNSKFNPEFRNESLRKSLDASNNILFLYVGRLAPEKDLDILLESIKNVNRSRPQKAKFIFVGDGPYAKKIKEASIKNVIMTGYLKNEKLSEIYASCDVFAFPSGTETFGNVIIEAMASGLPVITVDSGGVKDNMKDGHNGMICPPRDINSFTNSLIEFIDNRDLVRQMGSNAQKYASTLSWENIFDGLMDVYANAVNTKNTQVKILA